MKTVRDAHVQDRDGPRLPAHARRAADGGARQVRAHDRAAWLQRSLRVWLPVIAAVLAAAVPASCGLGDGHRDGAAEKPDESEAALFPAVVHATAGPLALQQIEYWAYVIQDVPASAELLERSRYQMLVLEPTRTDWSSDVTRGFPTKALVTRLKASAGNDRAHRKLVLAYVDIGQAEDWRWYWRWSVASAWDPSKTHKPGDWPSWIVTHDPEWEGCFPVAYWHPAWWSIVIDGHFRWDGTENAVAVGAANGGEGYASMLDEVVKDGFDGVYLDWVEACSDQAVIAAAAAAGVDPVRAMFDLMAAVRKYGRARFRATGRDPDEWLVVQQNAPDLADSTDPRRYTVIDGIAEEGVWWEGGGDSGWQDPAGHDVRAREKLGAEWCRDVRNVWLPAYQRAGIPVFVCEYAVARARDVYEDLAPRAGFVPYCTRRSLARLSTTPPSFE